jgi:hypothetical protein
MSENITKWWHRMSFWNKVERSFGLIGAVAVTEMGLHKVDPKWFVFVGICGLLSKLLLIWIEDQDGNGKPDIIEGK